MPWSGKEFSSRHNKKLKGAAAAHAAKQANAILRSGAPEGVAIATANKFANRSRLKHMRNAGAISDRATERYKDVTQRIYGD